MLDILPCIECGCTDINIGNHGYSSFDVAWGRCIFCKNEIIISPYSKNRDFIIEKWNNENDPNVLRERYISKIEYYQEKIDKLPK